MRSAPLVRTVMTVLLTCGSSLWTSAETLHLPVGVTAAGSPIRAAIASEALDPSGSRASVLVVAGLDGRDESVDLAAALRREHAGPFSLSAILNVFPDRPSQEEFPPPGPAYGEVASEAHYVWRFIGLLGPDLVVDLRTDDGASALLQALDAGAQPAAVGRVPGKVLRIATDSGDLDGWRQEAAGRLDEMTRGLGPSGARRALQARLQRTPLQVARQLAETYGHSLETATYIPALALIGRLRLGDLENQSVLDDAERIARPFLGAKASLSERPNGSQISGHLVFAELYERTQSAPYLALARAAADLGFDADGSMRPSMPAHNEMSDSVFMGCAILARVGRLTSTERYLQMAVRHLRFMRELDLRSDGLYRHSPLDEAAWGRGNGFAALGLALALTDWPETDPGHGEVLAAFRDHIAALVPNQDRYGTWHQVIDRPESYREFTATSMITFAITRGLRRGWLPREELEPVADAGWRAVLRRIKADGTLVDVCRSTGRQDSLRAYFNREAILGHDDRGGAMALLLATERAYWERER